MTSTDAENPLAYLDYSQLQDLIEENWAQFAPALIRQPSWTARQEELARIRHRIGHMRRPHEDDLNRIEQTLRDLEQGAFIACASYNKRITPSADKHNDAVTAGWLRQQHPTAKLIDHASSQYGTHLALTVSRRPWVQWPENLANAAGILWHAGFFMRERTVDISDFWHRAFTSANPRLPRQPSGAALPTSRRVTKRSRRHSGDVRRRGSPELAHIPSQP